MTQRIAKFLMVVSAGAFGWMIKFTGCKPLKYVSLGMIAMSAKPIGEDMRGFVTGIVLNHFEHAQKKCYICIGRALQQGGIVDMFGQGWVI